MSDDLHSTIQYKVLNPTISPQSNLLSDLVEEMSRMILVAQEKYGTDKKVDIAIDNSKHGEVSMKLICEDQKNSEATQRLIEQMESSFEKHRRKQRKKLYEETLEDMENINKSNDFKGVKLHD